MVRLLVYDIMDEYRQKINSRNRITLGFCTQVTIVLPHRVVPIPHVIMGNSSHRRWCRFNVSTADTVYVDE